MSLEPKVLKGALIGCGYVSQFHLKAWPHVPNASLVAICDLREDRLEWAAAHAPGAKQYRDVEAMFDDVQLDFVEICTRPESHRQLVSLSARHHAHVLCQKPAAVVRADLVTMIGDCEAAGVRLMIHENWRFRHWYRTLRAEIESGRIGRPIRLRIAHRDTRVLRADGFADQPYLAEMPRLILLEMGCHLIDTARYLLGEIHDVSATLGRFGGHQGEDVATLSVRFASGALGLLDMSWCAPAETSRPEWALNETVVEGTAGTLRLEPDGCFLWISPEGKTERRRVPLPPPDRVYVEGYIATQAHFIDSLLRGTPHETSGSETLKTMDVVWAGYRSAEASATITL
ncbi:MAG TPA: Gfo/Idh/MocA family oxidoreductase [Isosphaeraceae bacterium]|jgi:predicted dehydrogenase|nr:Gfo/Idh/MocA family oxidoreductase [Isosphaeraceae bacterium]